ncbi:MAG: SDR family NAD(P)-dependent oxidoreductase, partial [Planctomycetales bacterium]|nr:SDR family NAD(P)-dependent oxidoreductase [Planctomycetales bacterium]
TSSPGACVVNIGSVLGHFAVAKKSEYCASKFALHGFSDALRLELAPLGVDVLLVSPSTTQSEFFEQVIDRPAGDQMPVSSRPMSAEAVARATVDAIERGRRETILTLGGKAVVWADRLAPSLLSRVLARRQD